MNPGYIIKEGFSNLRRAAMATFVAVTIMAIALCLLSFFLIVTFNISYLIEDIRSRVELEAFLDKSIDSDDAPRLREALQAVQGVDSLTFISKAQAARILKSIMGEEDLFDLVESNPLPASFRIRVAPEFRNGKEIARIAADIESIRGVDEVNYQKEMLEILDEKIDLYNRLNLMVGVFAAIASVFLVSNTIKLSIYAKRDLIKTMKLVGATNTFIASPFVFEGFLQGLFGSLIAAGVSYGVVTAIQRYVFHGVRLSWEALGIILGVGIVLGLVGSILAVRFFLKERISDM